MHSPVPAFAHSLTALSAILAKAKAHEEAKKIKPEVIPQLRLIADMLPLWRQICIATDHAKGASARLAGRDVPPFPDIEQTLDELIARIAKTLDFIRAIPDEAYEGAEDRTITIKAGARELTFPAPTYLHAFAIPNFYFHMTTAYNILRTNGVELGKVDFLGG